MKNSYIMAGDVVCGIANDKPFTCSMDHPNVALVMDAIKNNKYDDVHMLINVSEQLLSSAINYGDIKVNTDAGMVFYKGRELHNTGVDYLLRIHSLGLDIKPVVNFLNLLMTNPSERAVKELWGFLEYGKLPLMEDGRFVAYKRVRDDYMSIHDGTTMNAIGTIVELPRTQCDSDGNNTCSHGLHFCSHEYLRTFRGERVVLLAVNPADVVSIPVDYNNTKGRACKYEIIGELDDERRVSVESTNVLGDSPVFVYDDENEPREIEFEFEIESEEELEFSEEYNKGYKNGRDGPLMSPGVLYSEGYRTGFKDGKSHKRRQY